MVAAPITLIPVTLIPITLIHILTLMLINPNPNPKPDPDLDPDPDHNPHPNADPNADPNPDCTPCLHAYAFVRPPSTSMFSAGARYVPLIASHQPCCTGERLCRRGPAREPLSRPRPKQASIVQP